MLRDTESHVRVTPMYGPWLEAQGGCFPEALDEKQLAVLLVRLYKINDLLQAPWEVVDGGNNNLTALLSSQLGGWSTRQRHCHCVELEELMFEIRRTSSAAECRRMTDQIYVREVIRMGTVMMT
mmetsp:Transcript_44495/g.113693  ORF Transcript_44495/g.113693 Transcript_44495/m.113693 type:complete len:124 (+) Transcript_44495:120-491(+)